MQWHRTIKKRQLGVELQTPIAERQGVRFGPHLPQGLFLGLLLFQQDHHYLDSDTRDSSGEFQTPESGLSLRTRGPPVRLSAETLPDAGNQSWFHLLICLLLPGKGLDLSKQSSVVIRFILAPTSLVLTALLLLTPTGTTTLWRMLRPLLTHLDLLSLYVSVGVVLVTLNVRLNMGVLTHTVYPPI